MLITESKGAPGKGLSGQLEKEHYQKMTTDAK